MFPLDKLFTGLVRYGRLRVMDIDGATYEFGDKDAPLDAAIVLHDSAACSRTANWSGPISAKPMSTAL